MKQDVFTKVEREKPNLFVKTITQRIEMTGYEYFMDVQKAVSELGQYKKICKQIKHDVDKSMKLLAQAKVDAQEEGKKRHEELEAKKKELLEQQKEGVKVEGVSPAASG